MTAPAISPSTQTPTIVRVGATAALAAGLLLLAKVAVLVATGNSDAVQTPLVAVYLLGILLPLFAAPGIARAFKPEAGRGVRIALAVAIGFAHLIYITMLSDGVGALVAPFTETEYLIDEVPVAVAGMVWLFVGLRVRGRVSSD